MPSQKSPTEVRVDSGSSPAPAAPGAAPPAFLPEGDYGDIVVADSGAQITIQNGVVTNARLADMAANSVKARSGGTSGGAADLAVGTNTVVGRVGGNVVAAQLAAAQVADDAIDNTKIANMAANTVKVNNTLAAADPTDLVMGANTVLARAASGSSIVPLSVGLNTVVGRAGGDLVAAQVETAQLANVSVTNAKLAQMATATLKGRARGSGAGAPDDLSASHLSDLVFGGLVNAPWWFDDFTAARSVTSSTNPWFTGAGSWDLTIESGTLLSSNVDNTTSRPGVVAFDLDTGVGTLQKSLMTAGVLGTTSLATFARFFCAVTSAGSSATWAVGLSRGSGSPEAATESVYIRLSSTQVVARTRNGGVQTAETVNVLSTPIGTFRHLEIERLVNNDLIFSVDGTIFATIAAATHGISSTQGLRVTMTFTTPNNTTTARIDYVGCSHAVTRL